MGHPAQARADLDAILRRDPNDVESLCARAWFLEREGHYAEALTDFTAALRRQPSHLGCLALRAWLLAACPQEEHRDGRQALADARKACELTDWLDARLLATLAAAHAECEEFDEAVTWERRSIRLAGQASGEVTPSRLAYYEAGLRYGVRQR
jgi:tetratricopeptide (TPR) repeat protein